MDSYADTNYRRLFDTEGEWYCDDARKIETGAMLIILKLESHRFKA